MMFIVDGTGDGDDSVYQTTMASGFCKRIEYQLGKQANYRRGPTLWGNETVAIANAVVAAIGGLRASEPLYLVGHSRGGAAVIWAAKQIKREVTAMFLFDAVDRARHVDCDTISGNVKTVYHAFRNPEFARRFESERNDALLETVKNVAMPTSIGGFPTVVSALKLGHAAARDFNHKIRRFRTFFGNAGTSVQAPGKFIHEHFMCTHGAVGGVPWDDVQGDAEGSKQVWSWTTARMHQEGIYQVH